MIDVTTPSSPVQIGMYTSLGNGGGVAVSAGYVYFANGESGMGIFNECSPPSSMFTLSVDAQGSGTGTITSSPAGIDCGATCQALFDDGTFVTLSATMDTGTAFDGWVSDECSGTGDCLLTLNGDKSVVALCNLQGTCGLGDAINLEHMTIDWAHEFEACTSISAGNGFQVASPGAVIFRVGQSVALPDGFSVGAGASFTVDIDPGVGGE